MTVGGQYGDRMPTDAILQHGWQHGWQQCYADWLSQIERKSGRANTRRAYEGDVVDFFSFSGREPGSIDATHAEAWVQELTRRGLAPATLNRKLSSLSSLYRYAGEYPGLSSTANPFTSRSLRTQYQPSFLAPS